MNLLVCCNRCGHGVVAHGDLRCEERGCGCALSHRAALEREIGNVRSGARDRLETSAKRVAARHAAGTCEFGRRVRELRIDRGWSQSRLAVKSGVERTTLQRIEAGLRRDPGFSIVVKLARAFEVTIETFVVLA